MPSMNIPSTYYLKSPHGNGLVLPSTGSDGWATVMNNNWSIIDAKIKTNQDAAAQNLSAATDIQSGGIRLVNQITNPNLWSRGVFTTVVNSFCANSLFTGLSAATTPLEDPWSSGYGYVADGWKTYWITTGGTSGSYDPVFGVTAGSLSDPPSNNEYMELDVAPHTANGTWSIAMYQRLERWKCFRGEPCTFAVDIQQTSGNVNITASVYIDDPGDHSIVTTTTLTSTGSITDNYTRIVVSGTPSASSTMIHPRIVLSALNPGTGTDSWSVVIRRSVFVHGTHTSLPYTPSLQGKDSMRCRRYSECSPNSMSQLFPTLYQWKQGIPYIGYITGTSGIQFYRTDPKYPDGVGDPVGGIVYVNATTGAGNMVSVTAGAKKNGINAQTLIDSSSHTSYQPVGRICYSSLLW